MHTLIGCSITGVYTLLSAYYGAGLYKDTVFYLKAYAAMRRHRDESSHELRLGVLILGVMFAVALPVVFLFGCLCLSAFWRIAFTLPDLGLVKSLIATVAGFLVMVVLMGWLRPAIEAYRERVKKAVSSYMRAVF